VTTTPKSLLRRLRGVPGGTPRVTGARGIWRWLILLVLLGAALWCGALARADTTPSPTTPTTTTDAPPPDPYQAPAPKAKPKPAPQHHAPVAHSAAVAPARTYTPAATVRTQPSLPATHRSVKPHAKRHAKPVRRHRPRSAAHVKQKPISLAPLADLAASIRGPVPIRADDDPPFRLLAGISLAVLAVGGCGLLLLSLRIFRAGLRLQ
jgi:hypothetical protein